MECAWNTPYPRSFATFRKKLKKWVSCLKPACTAECDNFNKIPGVMNQPSFLYWFNFIIGSLVFPGLPNAMMAVIVSHTKTKVIYNKIKMWKHCDFFDFLPWKSFSLLTFDFKHLICLSGTSLQQQRKYARIKKCLAMQKMHAVLVLQCRYHSG